MPASIKVVVDTNIFISALLKSGSPRRIIEAWLTGEFILVTSERIFNELLLTLRKPTIAPLVSESESGLLLETVKTKALFFNPRRIPKVCRDEGDDPIIACAVESKSDILVTGDKDMLVLSSFKGVEILTPTTFFARLRKPE